MLGRRLRAPRLPRGVRAYAIGDIHGRVDLLDRLVARIDADDTWRPRVDKTILVFLGDYIDRGPDSAQVIDRLVDYPNGPFECHFLAGNHEEAMLRVLAGETAVLHDWLRFGGRQCLQSYRIDVDALMAAGDDKATCRAIAKAIPARHRRFLEGLVDSVRCGDYLFVHAGVDPAVDLSLQRQHDLRWIRGKFLNHDKPFGAIVVHGHTVSEAIDWRDNRIGIDTGAYFSGRLSALGLEGTERWSLDSDVA